MAKRSTPKEIQKAVEEMYDRVQRLGTPDAMVIWNDTMLRLRMLQRIADLEVAVASIMDHLGMKKGGKRTRPSSSR